MYLSVRLGYNMCSWHKIHCYIYKTVGILLSKYHSVLAANQVASKQLTPPQNK